MLPMALLSESQRVYYLQKAAKTGDSAKVTEILSLGVDVNGREDRLGHTALMLAAEAGHAGICDQLIRAGAKLDLKERASPYGEARFTALHHAVEKGHLEIAKMLLSAGASVDSLSQNKNTPLVQACYEKNVEMVKLLLSHGANPNGSGRSISTPLMAAALDASPDSFVIQIAERHIVKEKLPPKGVSIEIVRELLKAGADPNLKGSTGDFPLNSTMSLEIIQELLRAGADVNARDRYGKTCLMNHVIVGRPELLRLYIEHGVDVNAKDHEGINVLMKARNNPRLEVFELLVEAGADVNATDKTGCSVLDWYLGDRSLPPRTKAMVIDFLRGKGAKSGKELHGESQ